MCQSEQIVPLGHVAANEGMVKIIHRCETCGTAFVFALERSGY